MRETSSWPRKSSNSRQPAKAVDFEDRFRRVILKTNSISRRHESSVDSEDLLTLLKTFTQESGAPIRPLLMRM